MRTAVLLALPFLAAACTAGAAPPAEPAPGVAPFSMGEPDVVLLVTGAADGLEETDVARRAGLVRRYRAAFPRVVLLDAGDAFRGGAPHDPRQRFVVRAFRETGYDAVVLGPHEWLTPLRDLRRWLAAGDVAWLSTTAAPKDDPPLPLAREVKREWDDRKLAFVSDLRGGRPALPKRKLDELAFAPPARLRDRVAALKKAGFAVVAVAHGDAKATAAACDADLVVQAAPEADPTLREAGGRPLARVGGTDRVGVLALRLGGGRIAGVEYRLEAVDERWPVDERLRATAAAYAKAAVPKAPARDEEGIAYVAVSACADCHQVEYEAWKKRRHAHAFGTVAQSGRASDPTCLACHATGAGTETGFRSRDETPGLAGVGCQVCHPFSLDEHGGGGFSGYPPEAALCRRCHTGATDPGFVFEKRRAEVGCLAK